jgi:hypothetical protein
MNAYRAMITLVAVLAPVGSLAGSPVGSYAEARKVWEQSKGKAEYQAYASEFAQFNNHFQIDEKSGCYAMGAGSVSLMLVITHPDGNSYAVIERVFSDVDTAEARCFKRAYSGVQTKVPPFMPFVLQMDMQK